MSRIVVTGGAGRLGASVVDGLAAAGHEVTSVDRAHGPTGADGVDRVEHDLLDRAATAALFERVRPSTVVHLAAIAVPFSAPEPVIFQVNTALAYSVIDAALAVGVRQVLIASSPTVIGYGSPSGWRPSSLPIDEDHPRAPWNSYALSKVAVEELVATTVRSAGDRLRLGLFRPLYVIAPEEWAGAPTQQGHTVEERLADPALAAASLFNYVDARDVADFVLAWEAGAREVPNGERFFVGAADSMVVEPVGEALAREVRGTASLASSLGAEDPVFDSGRAERLLGWRARRSWRTELPADSPARKDMQHAG